QSVPASRLPVHPLISTDPLARLQHSRGQSLPDWIALRSGRITTFPDGVAFPASGEEIQELISFAVQTGTRLIPYGGGTSVVGHINPLPGDSPVLTIDLLRMNRLKSFDHKSMLATFGAGVAGPDLEAHLRAIGYTLGHYPQSFEYSTLGGWVATRSSGQQSLRYGRIEKLFAGGILETPLGTLEMPPFPASAAGPDLREIVLGSEGRLGILSQVTVRASQLPQSEDFHGIFFPDFDHGMEAVRQILACGLPLSMLRLSTAIETTTTLALAGHENLIGALEALLAMRGLGENKCLLLLGFTGITAMTRVARSETLRITSRFGGIHAGKVFGAQWHKNRFHTPYLRNTLWQSGYAIDTLETATDWAAVPEMIKAIEIALRESLEAQGEKAHIFSHLSHLYPYGASVYTTYLYRLHPDPEVNLVRWQSMKTAASQAIVAHGGTISHQHGVGIDHAPYLPAEKGRLGIQTIEQICQTFDPHHVMNPGKLLVGI
ncbi:MAG: FAD-binding oxidoreductase, partial [Anaerolineales bacterium]|nr:FAD-binding oxidoreductase [Anaerolineales bacterium]